MSYIVDYIKKRQIKRIVIANELNVSIQFVSAVLNKRKKFSYNQIIHLCNYFNFNEKNRDYIILDFFLTNAESGFRKKILNRFK